MQVCVGVRGKLRGNTVELFSNTRLTSVYSLMRQSIQIMGYDGWPARNHMQTLYQIYDMYVFLTFSDGFKKLDV
jgi:hypothetical protein